MDTNQYNKLINQDIDLWESVVKQAGISVD